MAAASSGFFSFGGSNFLPSSHLAASSWVPLVSSARAVAMCASTSDVSLAGSSSSAVQSSSSAPSSGAPPPPPPSKPLSSINVISLSEAVAPAVGDAGVVGVGVASSAAAMEAATVCCAASCEEAAAASALALDAPDDDDAAAEVAAAEGWGLGGSTSSLLPYAILLASWAVALLPSSTWCARLCRTGLRRGRRLWGRRRRCRSPRLAARSLRPGAACQRAPRRQWRG